MCYKETMYYPIIEEVDILHHHGFEETWDIMMTARTGHLYKEGWAQILT